MFVFSTPRALPGQGPPLNCDPSECPQYILPVVSTPCGEVDGQKFAAKFADSGFNFSSPPGAGELQQAIAQALASPLSEDTAISVPSGTYSAITIDVANLNGHELLIYSEAGTDSTKIMAATTDPAAVQCTGNGSGAVRLGYIAYEPDSPVPPPQMLSKQGFHGFHIDGAALSAAAMGVSLESVTRAQVVVKGNRVTDWEIGGVNINDSDDVLLAYNDVASNTATWHAPGVKVRNADVCLLARNWIHNNSLVLIGGAGGWQGGGVYAITDAGSSAVTLCGNFIYLNEAVQGAGVWMGHSGSASATYRLESNSIYLNKFISVDLSVLNFQYAQPGYLGGGVTIMTPLTDPPAGYSFGLWMVNNEIHQNNIRGAEGTYADDEKGGGVYIGCIFTQDSGMFGNAIHGNQATTKAGGVYLGAWLDGTGAVLRFYNNTMSYNELTASLGKGSGLYPPSNANPPFDDQYPAVEGINNAIAQNSPFGQEWFGECLGSAPPDGYEWTSSQFQNLYATNSCDGSGGGTSVDLFGNPAITENDDDNPLFDPDAPVGLLVGSPCLDSGDNDARTSFPGTPDEDFQRQRRVTLLVIDRGADEGHRFIRGDVNYDGVVDCVDWCYLDYMLKDPTGLRYDAMDLDDNGTIDPADLSRIVAYIDFGLAPDAPFPNCGYDVRADGLPEYLGQPYCN